MDTPPPHTLPPPGEGGQGRAAGGGSNPQGEQPTAEGGVAEHGGPTHQGHGAAVQNHQAVIAPTAHPPPISLCAMSQIFRDIGQPLGKG